jgi:hypothetical protein
MHTRRHTAYLREATTFACLLVENRLLRMAVALQQLQEAFLQARLMNRGVLTACRLVERAASRTTTGNAAVQAGATPQATR